MATTEQELQVLLQTTEINPPKFNADIIEKALTQMNFSNSAKKLLLDPNASQTDVGSLQSIALTQEHLSQVKKSLGAIVDSIQENPSLISRAAKFWGELPLWQRITGGVVISGPTLVIGAAAHIGFLVIISGVSVVAYTTGSIVLDDHHYHTQSINDKLKAGIFGVAEVLELTIGALDSIRKKLTVEVARFKEENEKLELNIYRLNDEVETLSNQIEVYVATEKLLRETKEKLEKTAESLKKDLESQSQLIEANQKEVAKAKDDHEKSLQQLAEKISELDLVRKTMGSEVQKAKKVAATLEGTVKTLSVAALSDTNQRQAFQEKLNAFLTDKTSNFDQVAERLNKTETELAEVKSELKTSNERYKELLDLQESYIRRLEQLDRHIEMGIAPNQQLSPSKEPIKVGGLLSTFSFMALPQIWQGTGNSQQPTNSINPLASTN